MTKLGFCFPAIALAAFGQIRVSETCERRFEADFQPGQAIRMELRSGDIRIVGGDEAKLLVSCDMKAIERAHEVKVNFNSGARSNELRVRGGPMENFRLRIQVPRNTHLFVRSPAGDLTVSGIRGDKDVELHAGDLKIEVGDPTDYRRADASVNAGDLNGYPFGVQKGGLFRSFTKTSSTGKYRLHAHVGAGDVVLR